MKAAVAATLLGLAAAGGYPKSTYEASSTSCEESSTYPVATSYPASTYPAATTYPASTYPVASSYPASSYPVASSYPASSEECSYTTEVVTAYTTYCPEATVLTHGKSTYKVTAVS
jgi:hypothetical protein